VKGKVGKDQDWHRLREMSEKIEEIERLVLELKELGHGMPVIEKNVCSILSFIHVLKCGISDVAEITDKRGY
jgi:predicted transcriptional regulator